LDTKIEANEKRIENLEKLYDPVARLKTLFIICIFILGALLYEARSISNSTQASNKEQGKIREDIAVLTNKSENLKRQFSETKSMIREHLKNGK
jgi:chaperonin cofactor prefoldin